MRKPVKSVGEGDEWVEQVEEGEWEVARRSGPRAHRSCPRRSCSTARAERSRYRCPRRSWRASAAPAAGALNSSRNTRLGSTNGDVLVTGHQVEPGAGGGDRE